MLVPSEWQKPSRTGGEEGGIVFFFFSSRRRHTRCSRDWSSDVCSSDLAMGVQWRTLDVPGIDRLRGAGVYYGWGTSEAISCKGETVYVIGGANSAGQAAMHFSKFAEKVVMLVRGNSLASTMSHYLIEQIEKTPKIEVWTRSSIVGVHGDARLRDRKSTRLNSSHGYISYAVFCLKKKKNKIQILYHTINNYTIIIDKNMHAMHIIDSEILFIPSMMFSFILHCLDSRRDRRHIMY